MEKPRCPSPTCSTRATSRSSRSFSRPLLPGARMPTPAAAETPVLALEGVAMHFDGVRALDGVELQLPAGRVVALLGENGAGKSTAVKIMTGIYRPDAGRIVIRGEPVELHSVQDAWHHGITAVHQEPVMFEELSVTENIFAGHLMRHRLGLVDLSLIHI